MNFHDKIILKIAKARLRIMALTLDAAFQKDPNPENWRTINGSKVHLKNGRIDSGAGGKFNGMAWKGRTIHGGERAERAANAVSGLPLSSEAKSKLQGWINQYAREKKHNQEYIAEEKKKLEEIKAGRGASYENAADQEKWIRQLEDEDKELTLEKHVKQWLNENYWGMNKDDRKAAEQFLWDLQNGKYDYKKKGGRQQSLFGDAPEFGSKEEKTAKSDSDPIVKLLGEEFKGYKGKDAVDKLLKEKRGFVRGAFHNATLGDIALVYGNDFYGLQHIIKQRRKKQGLNDNQIKALLNSLDEIISHGKIKRSSKGRDTLIIKRKNKAAVVSPTLDGNKFTFVLTAFKTDMK